MRAATLISAAVLGAACAGARPDVPEYLWREDCRTQLGGVIRPLGPRTPGRIRFIAGCTDAPRLDLPAVVSRPAAAGAGRLRAGFGERDITPPPGFALLGYGPEGKLARGYRTRLRARAMVLEGANGERIALVVADLDAVSAILHRRVAAIVHDSTNGVLGADRILLSATHTHSGPAHFLDAWPANVFGSELMGYAPELVEWLAGRIAGAIVDASDMREARAAWGAVDVWGLTRNRMVGAVRLNTGPPLVMQLDAPPDLDTAEQLVNPRWLMLRVDVRDSGGPWRPGGSYSLFAIHGTVIPSGNDLYDGDVHGFVTRRLERALGGVHLLANGAEGDVSPAWPQESRCATPALEPEPRPRGPRTPAELVVFGDAPRDSTEACVARARAYLDTLGGALVAHAESLYHWLGAQLQDSLDVARAFDDVRSHQSGGS